jgi:geranylgeranyl diphosphate synthase type I
VVQARVAPPASLDATAALVDARIKLLLSEEIERWEAVDPDLVEPLLALRDFVLAGGKRLRPAFCRVAFAGAGGDPEDPAIVDAGAALELLHAFALIHDDIMDASERRRGVRTVHRDFERRHGLSGFRGERRRFGEGAAILVGDLAFVYADRLMAGAPAEAVAVFNELRLEVNLGQYLDLVGTARGHADLGAARRIAWYKSAKYTVERPLHLGAALAGRLSELAASLSAFGLPLGEAFQLRDDLLGAFGDEAVTGKPVGEDLREGKPTVLAALALARATGSAARLLEERLGAADLSPTEVAELQDVLERTGARRAVERRIDALAGRAVRALDEVPILPAARAELAELARYVARRDR